MTRRLSRTQVAELGIYDFMGYIGAFSTPYIGGLSGTHRLVEAFGIQEDENLRVLEIGCATGFTCCMIASEYDCHVTGIDLSEINIEKAKERAERLRLQNVEFQVVDAMFLPFEENSFDIVFGVAITAILPDKELALSEYMRVVRPGGMIGTLDLFLKNDASDDAINQFNGFIQEFLGSVVKIQTIDEWRQFYNSLGLEDIDIQEIYDTVLEQRRDTSGLVKATLKLLYHMIVNKPIRKKMLRLMKVRKSAISQNSEHFENVGYLIFTGRKPF